ncbi:uncharacterized protein TNCV_2973501 [Trichonephila clavipes]|nr:uncharacterized protein TNCV_2973501 [Trichonephila clavipes]
MSSSPVPLKTRRVGQRCTLNLSRAEMSSRWCGVVVRRGGASSGVVHVFCPWFKITWSVAKSPRVADQCDVNIHSLTRYPLLPQCGPRTKTFVHPSSKSHFYPEPSKDASSSRDPSTPKTAKFSKNTLEPLSAV